MCSIKYSPLEKESEHMVTYSRDPRWVSLQCFTLVIKKKKKNLRYNLLKANQNDG